MQMDDIVRPGNEAGITRLRGNKAIQALAKMADDIAVRRVTRTGQER